MFALTLVLIASSVASFSVSEIAEPAAARSAYPPRSGSGIPSAIPCVSGDNPLATYYSWTGNGGVYVDVVAMPGQMGTFSVSGIPEGASIVWAFLYEASWESLPIYPASAVFADSSLPWVSPFDHDPGMGYDSTSYFDLCVYRWDVTSLVTGNGDYDFSVSPLQLSYGEALVVVYSHPDEPTVQVLVNDGCESLYRAMSTTTFAGVSGDSAALYLFTQADEASGDMELISVNEEVVLGPGSVFHGNKGVAASLIELPVLCVEGLNTVSCSTDIDWFGWHLAVLEAPAYDLVELSNEANSNRYTLLQNSPNPFHSWTSISYSVPARGNADLVVYDIAGRLVGTLASGTHDPGFYHVDWKRELNPSGVYFYRLGTADFVAIRKMVVVD